MDGRRLSPARSDNAQPLDTPRKSHLSREDIEQWAQVVTASLVAQSPPPAPLSLGQPPPEAWRSDVGVLTEGSGTGERTSASLGNPGLAGIANLGNAEGEPLEHLQIRVDVGDLGETAFVVERHKDGLRILVASADPAMVKLLEADQNAMLTALRASGQSISGIRIVSMDQVGTNLAQTHSQSVKRGRLRPHQAEEDQHPAEGRRKARRINLTG
jgi:hypothetical protein